MSESMFGHRANGLDDFNHLKRPKPGSQIKQKWAEPQTLRLTSSANSACASSEGRICWPETNNARVSNR